MLTLALWALLWFQARRGGGQNKTALPVFGKCVFLYEIGLCIAWIVTGADFGRVVLIEAASVLFWAFWLLGRAGGGRRQYRVGLGIVVFLALLAVVALPNVDDDYLRLNGISEKAMAWLRNFPLHIEPLTMHRNTLAGMVATFSPLAFAYFFMGRRWWERIIGGCAGLAMLGVLLITNSRGSLVAFGIGMFILGMLLWAGSAGWVRLIMAGSAAIGVGVIGVYLVVSGQYQLFSLDKLYNENGADRLSIWSNTVYMLGDAPLTGFGPGNFQSVYPFYLDPSHPVYSRTAEHAHNLFLQTYIDLGICGLLAIAGATCLWARVLWQMMRRPHDITTGTCAVAVEQRILLIGGIAAFGAMLGYGVTEHSTWNGQFAPLFWVSLACVAAGAYQAEISVLPARFSAYLAQHRTAYIHSRAAIILSAAVCIGVILELIGLTTVNVASLQKIRVWQGDTTLDVAALSEMYHSAEASVGWTGVPVRGEAWIAVHTGDAPAAVALLQQALAHDPHDARSLLLLGDVLVKEGDSARALDLWRQAHAAPVFLARGTQLLDSTDDTRAEPDLLRALHIDPYQWDCYKLLVMLYQRHSRTRDSIRVLEQAITYLPNDPRPVEELDQLKKNGI